MFVVIAIVRNMEIVRQPRRLISMVNGLAVAGVPSVVEMLQDGDQNEISNLSDAIDILLRR